jgi:thiamine-phosphate pyrophosphorylase
LTPPALDAAAFADVLAAALDAGDVAAVQLRLKGADDAAWIAAIEALRPVAQSRDVAFLLNDRVDLVAHVGQQDMAVAAARRMLGDTLMLGATCHASRDLALTAGEAGADYVAFGAYFVSTTKAEAEPADIALLEWWAALMELPCVAIGGITAGNCAPLVRAGANFLAVCNSVWRDPAGAPEAVRALNAAIAAA